MFARVGRQTPPAPPSAGDGRPVVLNYKFDLSGPVAPGDSTIFFVGNFATQHNGALITCDSAVSYPDNRLEFFGNVLINKNTTYIYGDRAEYDSNTSQAKVFSDIIKVVDGDATLYTYSFLFNTETNIGEFDRGGVLIKENNLMESVRGYYYADTRELIAVDDVEMRDDDYQMKGDSVVYNMDTDNAYFFEHTHIWDSKGDFIYADRGEFHRADTAYIITRNAYLLTPEQEIWSDSVDYYRTREHIILKGNIQLDDRKYKLLGFGHYGEFWKQRGNGILTRTPAVVSYDLTQGDSLFMRADTMLINTLPWVEGMSTNEILRREEERQERADALEALIEEINAPKDTAAMPAADSLATADETERRVLDADSLGEPECGADSVAAADRALQDSLAAPVPAIDPLDTLVGDARKAYLKELAHKEKAARKAEAARLKKEKLDKIAAERKAKRVARLKELEERENRRLQLLKSKAEARLRARQERARRKGKTIRVDSSELNRINTLLEEQHYRNNDSLYENLYREWAKDSATVVMDSLGIAHDSVFRLVRGFRDVKVYRSDFQSVCDSVSASNRDSVIRMYVKPVLWNGTNQVTSEQMELFTRNGQLDYANFIGTPMMASEVDSTHFNQITGKEMTAYFRNNEIYLNKVNSNARTLYYNQDGEPPVVVGLFFLESGGINFYFEKRQVTRMAWTNEINFNIYPIDDVPETQERTLPGFVWEQPRRPSQQTVFDGKIRPTERGGHEVKQKPRFPIRRRVDAHRQQLIEMRRWADRIDQVDPETVEWMHSLGYEVGKPREGSAIDMMKREPKSEATLPQERKEAEQLRL